MKTSHKPITADLIRATGQISAASLPDVQLLFDRLTPILQESLASLTAAPFRLSLDGLTEAQDHYPPADAEHVNVQSPLGALDAWMTCDRGFAVALADLCFGGTGKEPAADHEDRPPSRIELCLCQAVYTDFKAGLRDTLSTALLAEFQFGTEDRPTVPPRAKAKASLLTARYLFNAFGYSGELKLAVRKDDVVALFGKRDVLETGSAKPTLAAQIGATEVEVKLMLPPQSFTVAQLARLRIGQSIRLEARPNGPIHVTAEGQNLFTAQLVHTGSGLACVLTGRSQPPAPLSGNQPAAGNASPIGQ